ncbi:MAG: hypothetical protein ACXQT4_05780 [Methanotrichaceae archaeon]
MLSDVGMTDTEKESKEDLEGLYDLAIPIGMPVSVIQDLIENFELDPVRRMAKVGLIDDDVVDREILVLRGELETIKAAEKYMFEALDRRIAKWDKNEQSERYKKMYEKKKREQLEKLKKKED